METSNNNNTLQLSNETILSMNLYRIFFTLFLISLTCVLTAGGGWPQPKGKGYFKLTEWWLISDRHFTDQARRDPNVTTGIFTTSVYAEYGITDRLTAVLYLPFFSRTFQNNVLSGTTAEIITPGEAINGIGDTDISFKYGLTKPGKGISVSATATFGLPFGNDSGGSQGQLQIGDGEFNQILTLDAGTSWQNNNTPLYANVSLGFNNRNNGFSDEIRYTAELGAQIFNQKLWLIGRVNAIESLKNGDTAANSNSTSIFANNTEFVTVGGELAYNIGENWGVSVGYATPIRGEIIFAAPSYSVGFFTKF